MIQRRVSPGKDRIDPATPLEQGARNAQANGARLWAKPQSQRTRTGYCARTAQRVGASGPAAAGPSDTAAFRIRRATVGEAPVAADPNRRSRGNNSTRRSVWTCCGWSVGHSRAPQRLQPTKRLSKSRAAPLPFLRIQHKPRMARIVFDIGHRLPLLLSVAHVNVEISIRPKTASPAKNPVCFVSRMFLPALDNFGHRRRTHLEQDMRMIRHDAPRSQFVALAVKEADSLLGNRGDLSLPQMTIAAAMLKNSPWTPTTLTSNGPRTTSPPSCDAVKVR